MIANRGGRPGEALAIAREAAAKLDTAGMRAAAALARNEFVYAARWADLYRECRETSDLLLRSLGPRYPWLEGNAYLERAGCVLRQGDDGQARGEVQRAEVELTRAGLWPIALRATQFKGVLDDSSGNYVPVWHAATDGLRRYWTSQATDYRAQGFESALELAAAGLGWRDCAVVFYRGSIRFAHNAGNPEIEATNRSELARLLHETGDYPDEVRELEEVKRLLDGAGDSKDVRILRWEAALRRVKPASRPVAGRIRWRNWIGWLPRRAAGKWPNESTWSRHAGWHLRRAAISAGPRRHSARRLNGTRSACGMCASGSCGFRCWKGWRRLTGVLRRLN